MGGQYPPRVGQQPVPVEGERDGAGGAYEQGGAQGPFEAADVPAQGLLGEVEAGGGAGEVEFLRDGGESAQQAGLDVTDRPS